VPAVSATRLRRIARKPPGYVLRRVGRELLGEVQRGQLMAASRGRGPLTSERVVPGGLTRATALTQERVRAIGAFGAAIAYVRDQPGLRENLERRVRLALERRVELFGHGLVAVGTPPAWNLDPLTGRPWPTGFHRRLDVFDIQHPTDVKLVWELSRLRHCLALAQGAVVLDSEEAIEALELDIADWRARNPVGWTVNWTVAMEVALRAVNLICIDGVLLAGNRELQNRAGLVASLYQHGWFLRRNLEISDVNGNHFLANAVGLIWLGAYFGEVGEASEWLSLGVEMTLRASQEQVLEDGLDHEGSVPYHLLVLEMFLAAYAATGKQLAGAEHAIGSLLDAAVLLTDERGQVPDLGDDDGGRVLAFSDTPSQDARRVLALGAALLQHPGSAKRSRGGDHEDAIWLAGPSPLVAAMALERSARPTAAPTHLPAGGLVVMGQGKDRVVVDVGTVGFRGRGGHGHLDALSFVAWLDGELAIRDSGTGTYTADAALRNELRSAEGHNVVVVDGMPYAQIGGADQLWAIEGDSPPRLVSLIGDDAGQHVVARQEIPAARGVAVVEREISLSAGQLRWRDRVLAPKGATVRHLIQLPEGCRWQGKAIVHPKLSYQGRWPAGGSLQIVSCRWSRGYGRTEPGARAIVCYSSDGEPSEVSWTVVHSTKAAVIAVRP
jgi:Heparinase II/III-like protein/Heparinase II/III N-terminus